MKFPSRQAKNCSHRVQAESFSLEIPSRVDKEMSGCTDMEIALEIPGLI